MSNIEKLLPCPFRGGKNARLLRFDGNEKHIIDDAGEMEKKDFYPYIHCYDCDIDFCTDSTATPKEVIVAWNKRV